MAFLGYISIFLIACAILCGLWMKFKPDNNDVNFHAGLSMVTLVVCLVTIITYLVKF